MVQWGFHFRHLWGCRLVLAVPICKVLQPGCPYLAGQSPFCLRSNLLGSLDQHCSSPSLAWSVHNYMDTRYLLWDDTQATGDPQGSPCAWCTLLTRLIPHESWFRVVPRHSTAWLDWFPYSVDTRRVLFPISQPSMLIHLCNYFFRCFVGFAFDFFIFCFCQFLPYKYVIIILII